MFNSLEVTVKALRSSALSTFSAFILLASNPHIVQNYWQQTNGPYGGIGLSLAINSKGQMFAGSEDGVLCFQ
jgi:hypothetical protein